MTYGGKEDGGATLTLSKEEKARLEAGDRVTKVTTSRTGIRAIEVQMVTECPGQITRDFLTGWLDSEGVDAGWDVAKALDLLRQTGPDGGWQFSVVLGDLNRLVNNGLGGVPVKELLGLAKAPSARFGDRIKG